MPIQFYSLAIGTRLAVKLAERTVEIRKWNRTRSLSMLRNVKVRTTVGELIYALSEAASGLIPDEKTRYRVVAYMLHKLLDESYGARRPR